MIAADSVQYPDVSFNQDVRPGVQIGVQAMAQRSLTDPSTLVSVTTAVLGDQPVCSGNPSRGVLLKRAKQNIPTMHINAPLLIAQGDADTLVLPAVQDTYVAERCSAGQAIDYRRYSDEDHMGVVTGDSPLVPQLLTCTRDRFAGKPSTNTC